MRLSFAAARPEGAFDLAILSPSGGAQPPRVSGLDPQDEALAAAAVKAARFEGEAGAIAELFARVDGESRRLLVTGAGAGSIRDLERVGAALTARLLTSGAEKLVVDLTGATLVCTMTTGTNWAGTGGYGGYNNGKLYWFTMNSTNNYENCTLNVCNTADGSVTSNSYNANTGDEQRNCLFWESSSTHFYKGYFWNMRAVQSYSDNGYYYNSNTNTTLMFQNTSPMYDMVNERVCATLPPSVISTEGYRYGVYRHPIAAEGNQWALFYNYRDSVPTLPFALTKYQIPAGAPVRPAGAGMTVTYELEVTW